MLYVKSVASCPDSPLIWMKICYPEWTRLHCPAAFHISARNICGPEHSLRASSLLRGKGTMDWNSQVIWWGHGIYLTATLRRLLSCYSKGQHHTKNTSTTAVILTQKWRCQMSLCSPEMQPAAAPCVWTEVLPPAPEQWDWVVERRWLHVGGLGVQRELHHRKPGKKDGSKKGGRGRERGKKGG